MEDVIDLGKIASQLIRLRQQTTSTEELKQLSATTDERSNEYNVANQKYIDASREYKEAKRKYNEAKIARFNAVIAKQCFDETLRQYREKFLNASEDTSATPKELVHQRYIAAEQKLRSLAIADISPATTTGRSLESIQKSIDQIIRHAVTYCIVQVDTSDANNAVEYTLSTRKDVKHDFDDWYDLLEFSKFDVSKNELCDWLSNSVREARSIAQESFENIPYPKPIDSLIVMLMNICSQFYCVRQPFVQASIIIPTKMDELVIYSVGNKVLTVRLSGCCDFTHYTYRKTSELEVSPKWLFKIKTIKDGDYDHDFIIIRDY